MIVKKHHHQGRLILAVCDKELKGKIIEQKDVVLDLSSSFYDGVVMKSDEFINVARKSYIINAVGKNIIQLLVKNNYIGENEYKKINDVPYVMLVNES